MAIDPAVQTEVRRLLTVAEKESLLRGMEDLYSYLKNKGLLYSLQVNSKLVFCTLVSLHALFTFSTKPVSP